ncbi:MAG: hypothetical protein RSD39_05390, partial [Oscillospiraceae bacterium]
YCQGLRGRFECVPFCPRHPRNPLTTRGVPLDSPALRAILTDKAGCGARGQGLWVKGFQVKGFQVKGI